MSEVTKIHTVDGNTVTVNGNFIVELSGMPSVANLQGFDNKVPVKSVANLQGFDNKVLVNINNVTYMEVVSGNAD